jgi:transcription-repair coupling factor (superfamily II helicase)
MRDSLDMIKNIGGGKLFERGMGDIAASGALGGAKANVASSFDAFVLFVAADDISASKLAREIEGYGKRVALIPSKEEVLLYNKAASSHLAFERFSALHRLLTGGADVAVISVDGLARRFPPKEKFAAFAIEKGKRYDLGLLAKRLAAAGYSREHLVEEKGQFSLRGDILDVFPVNMDSPIRIDFFDVVAERIKLFEPDSGKSYFEIESAQIAPATDVFIGQGEEGEVIGRLKSSLEVLKIEGEFRQRAESIAKEVIGRIEAGDRSHSLCFALPFIGGSCNLRQYLPPDAIVIFDDSKLLSDKAKLIYREHQTRFEQLLSCGEILPESFYQYIEEEALFSQFEGLWRITLNTLNASPFYEARHVSLNCSAVPRYALNFRELSKDISNWLFGGYRVFLCCRDETGYGELERGLSEFNINLSREGDGSLRPVALILPIGEGFINHSAKFVLIGYHDVFIKSRGAGVKRRKKDVFFAPEIGDYIVHEVHGIGICRGIKHLQTGSISRDYVVIEYSGGDILYVPCDQMNLIAKYSGAEEVPRLNRLGGREFEKIKQRVKRHIRQMAIDLKALYAEREKKKGFAFSPDGPLQREFEEVFEYEETPDQLKSVEEIKRDMESPRIMDRLLCGDVGYGKTEVALRAAFKTILDGKQVAMLAPTTILSHQHFQLCQRRFEHFGVRVDVLNRLRSRKEQAEVIEKLKKGEIDLVIGTHRLLSKDVKFRDLGLLIVDEEQRFGVEDKEKIKNMKRDVDVLTLTATPIPRTLYMSLSGIRDISVIDTPPRERLPVQTYVLEYSDGLVRDAVLRELSRGGQVFILYNRVESIESFAFKVARIVPEAKVIVAHGQMKEASLERALERFYSREVDVLVCTTIIENGIDIPNVNTLIVYEADKLGLSQLYQLRGRVGRSNRLAHVYFTFVPEKVLTESAYKRLKAIMEFTEFGSGFRIAVRDLEIRGAGNVLGKQQHGHIASIGYDMYMKLLKQVVEGREEEPEEIESDISIDAYIPEKYIEDESQRMKAYQRIASMEEDEREELLFELSDIYGDPPQPLLNLIDIRLLKLYGKKIGAVSVEIKHSHSRLTLKGMDALKESVMDAMEKYSAHALLSFSGEKPEILFKGRRSPSKALRLVMDFCIDAV